MNNKRIRILVEVNDNRQCLFHLPADAMEPPEDIEFEPRHRLLRKLDQAYDSTMKAIQNADKGLLLWLSKIIRYLESKIGPEEGVLKALRKADVVEIVHPPQCQEKWVRRVFRQFVRRQVGYHGRWLVINFLFLPVTGAMMLLPGPNVFFGWNAYRLISHYLAREACKRVLSGQCELQFNPQSAIRNPQLV